MMRIQLCSTRWVGVKLSLIARLRLLAVPFGRVARAIFLKGAYYALHHQI